MEPDIYTLGGSLRRNSSSMWRNNGIEAFSRSSRDEDDEEALRWAALEKLPTYNRLRKGLLLTASRAYLDAIPVWWRWYYWGCPIAWTLYGLVASQFADFKSPLNAGTPDGQNVQQFLKEYFGFKHDYIGFCAVVVSGLAVIFAVIFAYSIKAFNFQRR
ncbi:hypothetical protein RJ641_024224 [Dillenia turbinata]|uniref:CDR ABC transporter domain-containing protein n=1 Tax=Dillenia turbinata TaxID=194707 RepID=A0AAN8UJ83_9MAGN